jgi:hypothetical protein
VVVPAKIEPYSQFSSPVRGVMLRFVVYGPEQVRFKLVALVVAHVTKPFVPSGILLHGFLVTVIVGPTATQLKAFGDPASSGEDSAAVSIA